MITRKYETKEDCVGLFWEENFDGLDSTLITENEYWFERWDFRAEDEDGDFESVASPMWNTWWEFGNSWVADFAEKNEEAVAACGFTLIYHDGYLWGLGIDGAGYSFRDTHFARLYDLMGLTWHE